MVSGDIYDIVISRVILYSESVYTICRILDGGPLKQMLVAINGFIVEDTERSHLLENLLHGCTKGSMLRKRREVVPCRFLHDLKVS